MDSRKIQTVGGGTYTVSLPKEWIETQGIAAGDRVTLHTHIDGPLTVEPPAADDEGRDEVTVPVRDDDPALLERTVRAAYVVGSEEVRLEAPTGLSADQRRALDRVSRTLPGVSVVDESETTVVVRTLLDSGEVSVRQSVRQLSYVTLSRYEAAIAALTDGSDDSHAADAGKQSERVAAMVDRSFARGLARLEEVDALGVPRPELFDLCAATRELNRIGAHAEAIESAASAVETPSRPAVEDAVTVAREARRVVADAVSVVVGDAGYETAQEALLAHEEVVGAVGALDEGLGDRTAPRGQLGTVLDGVRWTADQGGAIAEIGLRRAVREEALPTERDDVATDGDPGRGTEASSGK